MSKRDVSIGTVYINTRSKKYINDILSRKRLSYGRYSSRFEKLFASYHDSQFAILCNSGTSALQVGIHALKELGNWQDGDEIIAPSVTFVATINTILQNNLTPRLVDVDPAYYDIDANKIEVAITKKTRAIMVVHLFGQPANMSAISAIAKKHKLKIIEDSCETMLARYEGRSVGAWGDVGCFSTYAAHLITTGVGGFCTTSNPKVATLIKSLVNHGRDNVYLSMEDDDNTEADNFSFVMKNRFNFIHLGYSYRVTEMEAALGLAQLEEWEKIIRPRQKNAAYLTEKLTPLNNYFQLPMIRPNSQHVFMNYPIVIMDKRIDRDNFNLFLEQRGIETRHMMPLTNQPVYKKFNFINGEFPVANSINRNGFYIGCHQDLKKRDLNYVVGAFYQYLDQKRLPVKSPAATKKERPEPIQTPARYARKGPKIVQLTQDGI